MSSDVKDTIRSLVSEFKTNMEKGDLDTGEANLRSINTHLDYQDINREAEACE